MPNVLNRSAIASTPCREASPAWFGKLTREGVDVVEYTVLCDPGIARPRKYWD